jgi:hypothetical protein
MAKYTIISVDGENLVKGVDLHTAIDSLCNYMTSTQKEYVTSGMKTQDEVDEQMRTTSLDMKSRGIQAINEYLVDYGFEKIITSSNTTVKIPTLSKELKLANDNLATATLNHKKISEHLEPLVQELVTKMKMPIASEFIGEGRCKHPEGTTVIKSDDVYLADDASSEKFFAECNKLYKKEGYDVELNYCPILIARSQVVDAQHQFIDASMYLVSCTPLKREQLNNNLERRRKYLEITVNLVQSMIKLGG